MELGKSVFWAGKVVIYQAFVGREEYMTEEQAETGLVKGSPIRLSGSKPSPATS